MRHLRKIVLIVIMLASSPIVFGQACGGPAQPPCCGGDGQPPCDPDSPPVPITGVEFLIGAGALLGARRFWNNRKSHT
jgi:hypothetical protein